MKDMIRTCLIVMLACLSAGGMQAQNKLLDSPARKLQLAEFAIANLYVDKVDEPELVEAAIVSMLEKLDPHSTYSDPEEVKRLNEPLQGNFDGIGIQFNMATDMRTNFSGSLSGTVNLNSTQSASFSKPRRSMC
jgi:carboxyl-terminal processing protease